MTRAPRKNPPPLDLDDDPKALGVQPYLTDTSLFASWIDRQRAHAAHLISDLDTEIERLNAEIDARMARRAGLNEIVARCNAARAVTLPAPGHDQRPAPSLTQHREEGDPS